MKEWGSSEWIPSLICPSVFRYPLLCFPFATPCHLFPSQWPWSISLVFCWFSIVILKNGYRMKMRIESGKRKDEDGKAREGWLELLETGRQTSDGSVRERGRGKWHDTGRCLTYSTAGGRDRGNRWTNGRIIYGCECQISPVSICLLDTNPPTSRV